VSPPKDFASSASSLFPVTAVKTMGLSRCKAEGAGRQRGPGPKCYGAIFELIAEERGRFLGDWGMAQRHLRFAPGLVCQGMKRRWIALPQKFDHPKPITTWLRDAAQPAELGGRNFEVCVVI